MTLDPPPPSPARPAVARRRAPVLVSLATVLGLWFGLTAPSVSPVAPLPPAQVVVADAAPAPGIGLTGLVTGLLDAVTPDLGPDRTVDLRGGDGDRR